MATTTRTVTYEEWLRMPETEDRIEEVVNGQIRIMPPPKWRHSEVIDSPAHLLGSQTDRKEVKIKISAFGLVIAGSR